MGLEDVRMEGGDWGDAALMKGQGCCGIHFVVLRQREGNWVL